MKSISYKLILVITLFSWLILTLGIFQKADFGFDHLSYFNLSFSISWAGGFLILILVNGFFNLEKIFQKLNLKISLVIFAVVWLILLVWLRGSAPLLGDGLDRIQALPAGLKKILSNQPAPLDLFLHWLTYQILLPFTDRADYLSYLVLSYLAGVVYLASVIIFSLKLFQSNFSRLGFVLFLLTPGYVQLFAGYAENYSLIAPALLFWIWGVVESEKSRYRVLILSQLVLIFLHFFFLLLLPITLVLSWKTQSRRNRLISILLALVGIGVMLVALFWVQTHYRGLAIFLSLEKLFSLFHLRAFFNQQILASPGMLVLICFASIISAKEKLSRPEWALLISVLILLIFFFALRPVLGSVRDWDLFSIPAMLYTPALGFLVLKRLETNSELALKTILSLILISIFYTIPWLMLNHQEEKMTARIKHHLIQNQAQERWASSYGFLTLAKYAKAEGRVKEAKNYYQKAIEINPSYSVNHREFGIYLWNFGEAESAIKEMEIAHQINPKDALITKLLSHFYFIHSERLIQNNQVEQAEDYLQKLFELSPESDEVLKVLIRFYKVHLPDPEKKRYYEKLHDQGRE